MQDPNDTSGTLSGAAEENLNDGHKPMLSSGNPRLKKVAFTLSDKQQLLQSAGESLSDGDDMIASGKSPAESRGKSTLFNIRKTSKGKQRLSDKCEDEETEEQNGEDGNSPKSPAIVFVQDKATKFGFGTSSSDANLRGMDDDEESATCDADTPEEGAASSTSTPRKSQSDKQESSVSFSVGKSEQLNVSFIKERLSSPLRKKRASTSDNKSDTSPLLGKSSSRPSPVSSIDSTLTRPADNDGHTQNASLPSPMRSEDSSDDSQYINTSEEADHVLSPSILSDDGVGVCSKYSQLSEDGSSPSSPAKSALSAGEEGQKVDLEAPKERVIFEHSLELGVAFTEFVDVDSFRTSLGNKNPHTEDGFGGRSEEHLLILLRGGSNKTLKSYLRNSQWPAESDARRHMWENICTQLLKAGGHLYEEIVNELFPDGSGDDAPFAAPIDLDHTHSYYLTNHGQKAAKMVVNIICHLSPDIIYCPMLYPMSALFLHYMSPEACFNCMQSLLASARPQYFTQTRVKTEASKYVLRDLSKKYTKQAYTLMLRSAKTVEGVFDNWMWWLFRDLPFQYLVRIIDSFLLEGYKVLYRVTLAIVFLFAKDSSQQGNRNSPVTNITAAIARFCRNMPYDPKKLIKVGFGIRGLTRKEIAKLHDKNEAYLRSLPSQNNVPRVVSSQSMGQISIARSFQGPMHLQHVVSNIFSPEMLQTLWSWIPMRLSLKRPKMLFSSDEHGTALRTLYMKCELAPQTILGIKTTNDEIFGAYLSSPWSTRHEKNKPHPSFFGTGETFVFSLRPEVQKYPWTGALGYPREHTADHFMAGDDHMLVIGSGNGDAIYLDTFMNRCTSTHCDTFDNDPLCPGTDFSCQVVEVFGFID